MYVLYVCVYLSLYLQAELADYANVNEIGMDLWFREMLKKFHELESQYLST